MKSFLILIALLSVQMFFCLDLKAQANMYDEPAQVTFINTYVPISPRLVAAAKMVKEQQLQEKYSISVSIAYDWLKKKRSDMFLSYARYALRTGYYDSLLYYNIGIAYYIRGEKRMAKRYLKRANKHGVTKANIALYEIKKKKQLSYSWFMY